MRLTIFCLRNAVLLVLLLLAVSATAASAETTEFSYQGRLTESGSPADSIFDFEFRLYNAATGGTLVGTLQRLNVGVSRGVFTVNLDYGVNAFRESPRFLEIAVKPAGSPDPFVTLTPRQPVTNAPFAIKSLIADLSDIANFATTAATATNATQLGGVAASQYVLTTDPRMTDARAPTSGSSNYIQNATSQQASSNFNISGDGAAGGMLSANVVTSATQYNIGGNRVLAVTGSANTFAGRGTGGLNSGDNNSFFGRSAGLFNVSGNNNSFFGSNAGAANNSANNNAFFGYQAGNATTSGANNAFFGAEAGAANTTASSNAFFGYRAGFLNTAAGNSFFGNFAGASNTTATNNAFFGNNAGISNQTGGNNSLFGNNAGSSNTTGSENAFFGSSAGANNTASQNSFFGHRAGHANTTGSVNAFFGTDAGFDNTIGSGNAFFGYQAGRSNTSGIFNVFFGNGAGDLNTSGGGNIFIGADTGSSNVSGNSNTIIGADADVGAPNLNFATAIGASAVVFTSNTIVLGRSDGSDKVRIFGLGASGSTDLCRNSSNEISSCSSSLRYKTDVQTFIGGLDIVRQLRPITFAWKDGGTKDIGFGAEEVEKIEPLLVTRNAKGEIEGVKYKQITTVLVNAVREQQRIIEQQQRQIDGLKRLVCLAHPQADVCR